MKAQEMAATAMKLAQITEMSEDSGIIFDNGKDIKRVLAGIDMSSAELMIAKHLGFDAVAQHHPGGIQNPDVPELMARDHMKKLMECGVPINEAQKLAYGRKTKSHQARHTRNLNTIASVAKLLDMNMMAFHTPADMLAERFVQERMDALYAANPRCTVKDVLDNLMEVREYQEANPGQQPEVWVGDMNSYTGKIYVEMYGVGAPSLEEYIACAEAGIGTFITMHATPEVIDGLKKYGKANLIIAGHMASDSLGFNQILDEWEKQGVEIVRISGII